MSVDSVDSRPSAPPPPPPPPPKPPPSADSGSSGSTTGNAGAAESASRAQSPELTRRLNTDSFGAANNNLQATRSAPGSRAGSALADRYQDRFESAPRTSPLQLLQGGAGREGATNAQLSSARPNDLPRSGARPAGPQSPRTQPQSTQPSAARPGDPQPAGGRPQGARPQGAQQPQARREGEPVGGRQPPRPEADPATRARVEAAIARRLNGRGGNAREIADRMARRLGNGDMQRGMAALDRALQRGRLNVGLAGINGPFGGSRNPQKLDDLTRDMRNVPGGDVDAVLDNANGAPEARRGEPNRRQLAALTELSNLARELDLPMDVTSHSNGFNTLRHFLRENPNARLGNVTLVNPNIPPKYGDTQQAFRDMVRQSNNVRLITTFSDEAVPLSGAGRNGQGPVWQQQINAAAAAGVQNITVLTNAHHSVESVGQHINRPDRLNLDLKWDEKLQRTVPVDQSAWQGTGYRWTDNGLQWSPPLRRRRAAGQV